MHAGQDVARPQRCQHRPQRIVERQHVRLAAAVATGSTSLPARPSCGSRSRKTSAPRKRGLVDRRADHDGVGRGHLRQRFAQHCVVRVGRASRASSRQLAPPAAPPCDGRVPPGVRREVSKRPGGQRATMASAPSRIDIMWIPVGWTRQTASSFPGTGRSASRLVMIPSPAAARPIYPDGPPARRIHRLQPGDRQAAASAAGGVEFLA